MGTLIIKIDTREFHRYGMIDSNGAVWVVVSLPWWDLASRLWWWLCPADKKAWTVLTNGEGQKFRARIIQVARRHVHIRNAPIPAGDQKVAG